MLVFVENIEPKYDFQGGGVVSSLPSFSPKCQKITWGVTGASDTPMMLPMLFLDNLVKKPDKLSL